MTEITIDGTRYELRAIPNEPKPLEWEIVDWRKFYNKENEIFSVKRLTDGVVFSVGDEVSYEPRQKLWWVIDNFHIRHNDKVMLARSKYNADVEELNTIIKNKSQKPKEEVKEPERIEVTDFEIDREEKWLRFHFNMLPLVVKQDYDKIKQAIEKIINNEA